MKTNGFIKVYIILLLFLVALHMQINAQEMVAGKKVITGILEGETVQYLDGEIAINIKGGFSERGYKS